MQLLFYASSLTICVRKHNVHPVPAPTYTVCGGDRALIVNCCNGTSVGKRVQTGMQHLSNRLRNKLSHGACTVRTFFHFNFSSSVKYTPKIDVCCQNNIDLFRSSSTIAYYNPFEMIYLVRVKMISFRGVDTSEFLSVNLTAQSRGTELFLPSTLINNTFLMVYNAIAYKNVINNDISLASLSFFDVPSHTKSN